MELPVTYLFASLLWIVWCTLHSILIATPVTDYMKKKLGEAARLTEEELARRLKTKTPRMGNHPEDTKLSTLERTAIALGEHLQVSIIPPVAKKNIETGRGY